MYKNDGVMNWVEKKAFAVHHKHEVINAKNIDELEKEVANIGEPLTIFSEPTNIPDDVTSFDFAMEYVIEHGVGVYKWALVEGDSIYTDYYIILHVDVEEMTCEGFTISLRYNTSDRYYVANNCAFDWLAYPTASRRGGVIQ